MTSAKAVSAIILREARLPPQPHSTRPGILPAIVVGVLAVAATVLVALGRVSYAGSDPRGALLTSQALIEHGTFAVDAYTDVPRSYRIIERNGHRFYYYPPGTPLLAVPAVAVARLAGLDMTRDADDERLQRVLAAASVGLVVVLAFWLALQWFAWPLALTLTAAFTFATPVISTMGTALWSTDATVVTLLCGWVLLARQSSRLTILRIATAGAVFGFACWCRPPAVLAGSAVTIWLFARTLREKPDPSRTCFRLAVAFSCAFLIVGPTLLLVTSRVVYGSWLPDYYLGAQVGALTHFFTALGAHLVSPSRGLLVFAPIFTLVIVTALVAPRGIWAFPLAAPVTIWATAHLLLASRFPVWWAGYAYGPRLLVDMLPGAFILLCAAVAVVRTRAWQLSGTILLVLTAAAGLWINSVQGLFTPATTTWNAAPSVDDFPGYALDWRTPQFLASRTSLDARQRRHDLWFRPPLELGLDYASNSGSNLVAVESRGKPTRVATALGLTMPVSFLVAERTIAQGHHLLLTLVFDVDRPLTGEVCLNGSRLGRVSVRQAGSFVYAHAAERTGFRTMEYDVLQANELSWCAPTDEHAPRLTSLRLDALHVR